MFTINFTYYSNSKAFCYAKNDADRISEEVLTCLTEKLKHTSSENRTEHEKRKAVTFPTSVLSNVYSVLLCC
jgi:hypothetical protein